MSVLGNSPTLDEMAEVTKEFIGSFKAPEIRLIAHSVGSAIGLSVAATNELPITQVVAIDPFTNPHQRGVVRKVMDVLNDRRLNMADMKEHGGKRGLIHRRKSEANILDLKFWRTGSKIRLTPENIPNKARTHILYGRQDRFASLQDWYDSVGDRDSYSMQTFPGGHFWFNWQPQTLIETVNNLDAS